MVLQVCFAIDHFFNMILMAHLLVWSLVLSYFVYSCLELFLCYIIDMCLENVPENVSIVLFIVSSNMYARVFLQGICL